MGLKTEVRLDFGGERRTFNIAPIGCIKRIQDACDAGPQFILNSLFDGSWRQEYLRETIMQGLVGGGETQAVAQKLVETWLDPEPKRQFIPIATTILMAWLTGAEDEDLGELEGEVPNRPSPEESSASPASTDPVQS